MNHEEKLSTILISKNLSCNLTAASNMTSYNKNQFTFTHVNVHYYSCICNKIKILHPHTYLSACLISLPQGKIMEPINNSKVIITSFPHASLKRNVYLLIIYCRLRLNERKSSTISIF